jgi:hypothetical protein
LLERLIIGRWMLCCVFQDVVFSENDKLCGPLPKEGCLVLNPSTVSWVVMMVSSSLGRVFGKLKFL